jgi:hypothetical protein
VHALPLVNISHGGSELQKERFGNCSWFISRSSKYLKEKFDTTILTCYNDISS